MARRNDDVNDAANGWVRSPTIASDCRLNRAIASIASSPPPPHTRDGPFSFRVYLFVFFLLSSLFPTTRFLAENNKEKNTRSATRSLAPKLFDSTK